MEEQSGKEAALLTRIRAGDEQAFSEFYKHFALPLRKAAYAICDDWEMAEDIAQESLFRLYLALSNQEIENAIKFVFTTARNLARDERKSHRARFSESLRTTPESGAPTLNIEDAHRLPDKEQELREMREQIDRTLSSILPSQRRIIYHRLLSGRTGEEVSELEGITEKAVKSLLHRARTSFIAKFRNM